MLLALRLNHCIIIKLIKFYNNNKKQLEFLKFQLFLYFAILFLMNESLFIIGIIQIIRYSKSIPVLQNLSKPLYKSVLLHSDNPDSFLCDILH